MQAFSYEEGLEETGIQRETSLLVATRILPVEGQTEAALTLAVVGSSKRGPEGGESGGGGERE